MITVIPLKKPEIENYQDKAPALDGDFHYNLLASDRRFEELIYTIYKQKITNDKKWNSLFDDITLTAASGDKGADCILLKNGKSKGVIQCKKYDKNLDKPECAKEVLKFILYTIVDNSLMPDVENFQYYFAVSKAFTAPAIELLNDFGSVISERDFEKWIDGLKKKYAATIGHLNYADIKADLFYKARTIKIKKIIPVDLNLELHQPYNSQVQSLFFKTNSVVENTYLDKKITELLEYINGLTTKLYKPTLTNDEIIKKFEITSLQLRTWKGVFSDKNESHIKRDETPLVLNWVHKEVEKENEPLLMVVGNPGYGKSVILQDVFKELQRENIPVVGIKADRVPADSIDSFNKQTNLPAPLEDLVNELLKQNEKVVVLIDQIDALSSAVTSNRRILDTYNQIIESLLAVTRYKPNFIRNKLRIILSIREFDLTYDYEFRYYKDFEKVEVKKLNTPQLESVLKGLNLETVSLSDSLIDLIRIPSYLEVFCKVWSPQLLLYKLNTAIDLMNELWHQQISAVKKYDSSIIKSAVYVIVEQMQTVGQLSVSATNLEDVSAESIDYLKNTGILLSSDKQIQFFHQTFYDYAFARSFVEKGRSLEEYIWNEKQSIFIRPTLKIMLAFYRQDNSKQYLQVITKILFDNRFRFHIQLLIINELGFLENPSIDESKLVLNRILRKELFFQPFFESAIGKGWFAILSRNRALNRLVLPSRRGRNFVQQLLRRVWNLIRKKGSVFEPKLNLWSSIIRRALKDNPTDSIQYLYQLDRFEGDSGTVLWLLHNYKSWNNSTSLRVFEKYASDIDKEWYDRLDAIEETIKFDFRWSVNQFKKILEHKPNLDGNSNNRGMYEHKVCKILETLSQVNLEEFFQFGIELMEKNISQSFIDTSSDKYFIDASIYYSFEVKDHYDDEDNKLLSLLHNAAEGLSERDSNSFRIVVEKYHTSRYAALQAILIDGYLKNVSVYKSYCFEFIIKFLTEEPENHSLEFYARELIKVAYQSFTDNQKLSLLEMILELKSKYGEAYIYDNYGKRVLVGRYGLLKFEFLSSIPIEEINKISSVKRVYQELTRRYQPRVNSRPEGIKLHSVGPPLHDNAYKYMQLEDWIDSMQRFDGKYQSDFFSHKGGLTEHSREFAQAVEKRPDFFYPLIEKISTLITVDDDYLIEGLTGLEKAKFDPERFLHLYKLAISKLTTDYGIRSLIWLTNYLHKNDLVDWTVFNFLCNNATTNLDSNASLEESVQNSKSYIRDTAVREVVKCYYRKEYEDGIFKVLHLIANDPFTSVRLSALNYMAYLTYLDKEKTLQVFLSVTMNNIDNEVLKHSINTVQYLTRYRFKPLIPYFRIVLEHDIEIENVAIILALAWFREAPESYELLQIALQKSDKAKAKMIDVAINNYIGSDEPTRARCFDFLCLYLENDAKEIVHEYSNAFLRDMQPTDFSQYLPFLKKYYISKVAKKDPHYFFDYLIKCSKHYPEDCIDLIQYYSTYDRSNPFTGPHYDGSEPVKVVVGALNGLYERKELNNNYIDKAMSLFDEMLQNPIFREGAVSVLEKI